MIWIPKKWQPLPSNEWLLTLADYCHNMYRQRDGHSTFAVGAVGNNSTEVTLVIGVNSSPSSGYELDDVLVPAEANVPPIVRNALELHKCVMAKEPYHAEVSCVVWAKDNSMQLFAVASSRKVCGLCKGFLRRHARGTDVVDGWWDPKKKGKGYLTHEERKDVNLGSWGNRVGELRAVEMT